MLKINRTARTQLPFVQNYLAGVQTAHTATFCPSILSSTHSPLLSSKMWWRQASPDSPGGNVTKGLTPGLLAGGPDRWPLAHFYCKYAENFSQLFPMSAHA